MAWFILGRLLFASGVIGAAATFRPLAGGDPLANVVLCAALSAAGLVLEWRLRDASVMHVLGAAIGGTLGILVALVVDLALEHIDAPGVHVGFLQSLSLLFLPYLGAMLGGRHGEWLEPSRLVTLFRAAGPMRRYKVLDKIGRAHV